MFQREYGPPGSSPAGLPRFEALALFIHLRQVALAFPHAIFIVLLADLILGELLPEAGPDRASNHMGYNMTPSIKQDVQYWKYRPSKLLNTSSSSGLLCTWTLRIAPLGPVPVLSRYSGESRVHITRSEVLFTDLSPGFGHIFHSHLTL